MGYVYPAGAASTVAKIPVVVPDGVGYSSTLSSFVYHILAACTLQVRLLVAGTFQCTDGHPVA